MSLCEYKYDSKNKTDGFTVVELCVIIVVIGLLATTVFMGYGGWKKSVIIAKLKSDLNGAASAMEDARNFGSGYPTDVPSSFSTSENVTLSGGGVYDGKRYCISVVSQEDSTLKYYKTSAGSAELGDCPVSYPCDDLGDGFVLVPGSSTYGTSDFCVMAYEAKADDNGDGIGDVSQATTYHTWPASTYPMSSSRELVSTPQGYPVGNITQIDAIYAAQNFTANCDSGCHLITEAEWMTIVQNLVSNPVNWTGGSVGAGYIYNGHNDQSPNNALEVVDVNDQYDNTGNSGTSVQRRRLQLTNGEYIWDMAGNVMEWTSYSQEGNLPSPANGWTEWTAVTSQGGLPIDPRPSGTGIAGSSGWDSNYQRTGMSLIYSSSSSLRGFLRGGYWGIFSCAGLFHLDLNHSPTDLRPDFGLRVAR